MIRVLDLLVCTTREVGCRPGPGATAHSFLFIEFYMARDFNRSRGRTCPTCRNKTTAKTIHRVYFDVSDKPGEDTSALRNKIDNLEKQLNVKESVIKNVNEESQNLESQIEGLSELNKKLESKISARDNEISAATVAAEAARRNLDKLKRELQETSDQNQDLTEQLRIRQQNLSTANLNNEKLNEAVTLKSKLNKQLEDNIHFLEHEKRILQEKVSNPDKVVSHSGRNPRNSARQRLLLERPLPVAVQRPKLTDPAEGNSHTSTMFGNLLPPESKAYCQSEPHSPHLNCKPCSVRLTELKVSQSVTQHLPSSSNIEPQLSH